MSSIELNPNKQYVLAGDISASMQTVDPKCGNTPRYSYMLEKFKQFISESMDFDPDGPTVMLFGESVTTFPNTTLEKVQSSLTNIRFEGFTNTDAVIKAAWSQHLVEKSNLSKEGKAHPGTVLFVFTDGQPTNQMAVERIIIEIANAIGRDDEFSIGFLLVGTIDATLSEWLEKIDNGLTGKVKYDIVGTQPIEGVTFLKAVNNAINE